MFAFCYTNLYPPYLLFFTITFFPFVQLHSQSWVLSQFSICFAHFVGLFSSFRQFFRNYFISWRQSLYWTSVFRFLIFFPFHLNEVMLWSLSKFYELSHRNLYSIFHFSIQHNFHFPQTIIYYLTFRNSHSIAHLWSSCRWT